MFSLARLSCFIAVAEELHFGRAAERLHMTQPPLSRQIQQLEAELGVQLIDRTTRSVTLTPAGVAFLPDARRILQLAEGAALTVKRVPAGDLGTVVVGFTAASAHAVLPRLLERGREQAARRQTRTARDGFVGSDGRPDDRRARSRHGPPAVEAARPGVPAAAARAAHRRAAGRASAGRARPAAHAERPRRPGRHHVLARAGAVLQRAA